MQAKALIGFVALASLSAGTVSADPKYAIIGAALGGVAGAVVANNVNGISREVGIPVGAVLGGIIGNQYNQSRKADRVYDASPKVVVIDRTAAVNPVADPHPGVDLIKVSILNSNGMRTDIPILRTAGKFVGPQGEQYETLPTAADLTRRYGM
jgi:hypothetical protein